MAATAAAAAVAAPKGLHRGAETPLGRSRITADEGMQFAAAMNPLVVRMTEHADKRVRVGAHLALGQLGQCETATDLRRWEFLLTTLCYAANVRAAELAQLWHDTPRTRIARVLVERVEACFPFRSRLAAYADVRQFYEQAVLATATVSWVRRTICNYQMMAVLGDQLASCVFVARSQDRRLPEELRGTHACVLLAQALTGVAIRHQRIMEHLAAACAADDEFAEWAGVPATEWPTAALDALRLRGSRLLFALANERLLGMFAEMCCDVVRAEGGRMADTVRPPTLPHPEGAQKREN